MDKPKRLRMLLIEPNFRSLKLVGYIANEMDEYIDIAIATARAEALREAAERAVQWLNKDHYFDPPEPFDELRAAIIANKQEENNV
jgi:hypothetical protein